MTLTDIEVSDNRMNRSCVDIDSDNEINDDGERDSDRLRHAALSDFAVKSAKSSKKSSIENVSQESTSRSACKTNTASVVNKGSNTNTGPTRLMFTFDKRLSSKDPSNSAKQRSRSRNLSKDANQLPRHSFLTEVPDSQEIESSLTNLLDDFHSGKLKAFGKDCNMEQMTRIREQQEQLAKLHFEFGASIELSGSSLSEDSVRQSQSKMNQLIKRLEQLSVSIEHLHSTQDKS